MRTKKQIFMLLLALLVGIPTLSAQSKKEKKEQKKEAVKKLIESENYKIDVNTAMPMRGRSIPLTSSYSLEIRNDSVISYLPYYGRPYIIIIGRKRFCSTLFSGNCFLHCCRTSIGFWMRRVRCWRKCR